MPPKQADALLNLDSSSLNKCPKPSGQAFRPPQKQGNAHLNLDNSSLNKCPKPSGQAFRPPKKQGDAMLAIFGHLWPSGHRAMGDQ